jgi:hypothetical protein
MTISGPPSANESNDISQTDELWMEVSGGSAVFRKRNLGCFKLLRSIYNYRSFVLTPSTYGASHPFLVPLLSKIQDNMTSEEREERRLKIEAMLEGGVNPADSAIVEGFKVRHFIIVVATYSFVQRRDAYTPRPDFLVEGKQLLGRILQA